MSGLTSSALRGGMIKYCSTFDPIEHNNFQFNAAVAEICSGGMQK